MFDTGITEFNIKLRFVSFFLKNTTGSFDRHLIYRERIIKCVGRTSEMGLVRSFGPNGVCRVRSISGEVTESLAVVDPCRFLCIRERCVGNCDDPIGFLEFRVTRCAYAGPLSLAVRHLIGFVRREIGRERDDPRVRVAVGHDEFVVVRGWDDDVFQSRRTLVDIFLRADETVDDFERFRVE